ncbi:MAG TPA: hypothetical protein VEC38_13540 [Candidatus Binataceae bacterium]|nr:hypothetical protein [Candidatus Binataceae bacterium]
MSALESATMPRPAAPPAAPERRLAARKSLLRYSPALVAVAVAIADSIRFADPDLWGHIRFGQAVLSHARIAFSDPYSYSAPGHLWLNHEWLAEVIMAAAWGLLGVFGLKLMKFALAAAAICALADAESQTDAPIPIQLLVLVVTALMSAPWFQFRPQLFTFALLAALLTLLARDARGRPAPLWLAIVMFALWANLHGGFIIGIGALAVYSVAAGAQDLFEGRGWGRLARLGAITIASALATLATPYGIGIWRAIARALANPDTRTIVSDWQPLLASVAAHWHWRPLRSIYDFAPLGLGAALAASIAASRAIDDPGLIAVAAAMLAGALVSIRNAPIAEIAIAVPLARHLGLALARRRARAGAPGAAPSAPLARSGPANQLAMAVIAVALLAATNFFSARLSAKERYPASAVEFMQTHNLSGNVLDDFLWGEYLIWHLAPGSRVFVDGRYDTVYPKSVIRDYIRFHFGESDAVLDSYPHDFVLIAPELGARRLMDARGDWKLVYRDEVALLYARAGSPAARIAGVPIAGIAPPTSFP